MSMSVSSMGLRLARQATAAMMDSKVSSVEDRAKIGESYLGSVESQCGLQNEKVVAHTAKVGCAGLTARGREVLANRTFWAIAAGTGGPLGSVLAYVGSKTMHELTGYYNSGQADQAKVGLTFAAAVRDHATTDFQKAGAEAVLAATKDISLDSTVGILKTFLTATAADGGCSSLPAQPPN